MDTLHNGYKRFYQQYFCQDSSVYKDLKAGQSPRYLVISCSDSRVDPATITQCEPGEIFVVRNIANIVPPCESSCDGYHGVSAALQYAVCSLEVEDIIVLGHSKCGGIKKLVDEGTDGDSFVDQWIGVLQSAKEKAKERHEKGEGDLHSLCEREGIRVSLENLMSFPWVKNRVDEGKLKLHGWYFTIDDGLLREYDAQKDKFVLLETK